MSVQMNQEVLASLLASARVIATRQTQENIEIADSMREKLPPGAMFSLLGSLLFQNTVVLIALEQNRPGSESGEKFIVELYDSAKRDALERWKKQDLRILDPEESPKES